MVTNLKEAYETGGNSLDDIHTMTGSLNLTGSLALAGGAASITGGTLNLGSDSVAGIINSLGDVLTLAVDSNANTSGTPSIQFKSGSTELMRLNTTGQGEVQTGTLERSELIVETIKKRLIPSHSLTLNK